LHHRHVRVHHHGLPIVILNLHILGLLLLEQGVKVVNGREKVCLVQEVLLSLAFCGWGNVTATDILGVARQLGQV